MRIPVMKKVSPIVRRFLVESPHTYLERFNEGDTVTMEDPIKSMDFLFVLKGAIQINL